MDDQIKNLWDVILNSLALLAAAVAFIFGLLQWRQSQKWQRSEQLDKFVDKFESDELLQLATLIVDWTNRETTFRNRRIVMINTDVLLALRNHEEIKNSPMFPGEQATIRDAYDAFLTFFNRLELAISTGLIDAEPTKAYFRYWLYHFLKMSRHEDRDHVLEAGTPQQMVVKYIQTYGDIESVRCLAKAFDISSPELNPVPKKTRDRLPDDRANAPIVTHEGSHGRGEGRV